MGIVETVSIFVVVLGLAVLLVSRTDGWAPSGSARAERELELPLARADAFDRARVAVLGLRLLHTARVNEKTGTIEARVFGSWRTLGDFVKVQVDEIDAARSRIRADMQETVATFARRRDVTLQAFGWRLLEMSDGPCYRAVYRGLRSAVHLSRDIARR